MRKTFVTGLLVIIPLSLTIFIVIKLFYFFDGIFGQYVSTVLVDNLKMPGVKNPIPGLGLLFLVALVFLAGTIARNYLGSRLLALGDYIVTHIPLMNRIYVAIREISEAFLSEKREVFKKAVLIEYPRKGMYSVGFFTQDTKGPIQDTLEEDVVSVFLPTSPNPTSGYLLFVPKSQVTDLDMPVEDALKLVISAGSVQLKDKKVPFPVLGKKRKKVRVKEFPGRLHQESISEDIPE